MLACFHSKGTCHVCFATSGCAGDKDVTVLSDIFTARQPLNQGAVQFPTGMIINSGNRSIWLLKLGFSDEAFEAVVFSAGVFNIHKHSKTILKRDIFHTWLGLI